MVTDDSPPSILAKAFALLEAFTPENRVMSLSEIGRASGLPKSTVHRLLARLIELGAVEHHRGGYRVGIVLLRIGATTPAMSMRDVAAPHLAVLHQRTGLTVHLAVLRGFDIVILDWIASRGTPVWRSGVGNRMPAHCTALGKALLAGEDQDDLSVFLPQPLPALTARSRTDVDALVAELRRAGPDQVVKEVDEAQIGVACVAAPIRVMGSTVAAVSVAHPAGAPIAEALDAPLRQVSSRIAADVSTALTQGRIQWFPREIDQEPTLAASCAPTSRAGSYLSAEQRGRGPGYRSDRRESS